MMRSLRTMRGGPLAAEDGNIGYIADVFFDDLAWNVRYFVVDTFRDMPERQVLVPPALVERAPPDGVLHAHLTRAQVKLGPDIDEDQPVHLQWDIHRLVPHGDPHLRSSEVVLGYAVQALDGPAGRVVDLEIDDGAWSVAWLVVDTGRWLPGKLVMLPPNAVQRIEWPARVMHVALTGEALRHLPAARPR
jgi:hypothetical protein